MTSRLSRYLSVLFLQRLFITLFGMVTLLGVLDALGNADLVPDGAGLVGQVRYMVLRMPILFDRTFVFGLLLAVLLTYASLYRRNELVIISGSGLSVFGQVRALAPAVIFVSVVSAIGIDQINPVASKALEDWLGTSVLRENSQTPERVWLSDGRLLVEVAGMQNERLSGLTIFERDANGAVIAVTTAGTASPVAGGWRLEDTEQQRFDGRTPQNDTFWSSAQTPDSLHLLLTEPRDLALADLLALHRMRGSGSRPASAYLLWALHRISLPLAALAVLMLAVPIMQLYGRRDSSDIALARGVAAGFVFMVTDGVLKTLAESGRFSAPLAVALPILGLALAGLWLALGREVQK
ncbi:LptF/LptG family permease [Hyphomonas johnsonii]|uniref:Putative permease n=1 Tax=Hyphomonas johnsonii MHS-2 TaxID=1280950 RepID=A0A059FBF6_9PROT|nr:LptF/LptG family permease [Hyphomonas johnsonii]KCZ87940.1 putative permease [Hyphomonas johnsonii MHS-2]